jgi:membrane-bound serine protease (ClpP class)
MSASRSVQVGDTGRTTSALRPYGTVQIGDLRVEAMIEGGYLQSGTEVRVREVQGARIVVEVSSHG